MKIEYFSDTDSLYIHLSSTTSSKSEEIAEGTVIDYDENGNIVGIDVDNASTKLELEELTLDHLPVRRERLSA
ncbi:MAG: DUF2283 domain-containing protein [Planctomycetota bacterium]